MLKLGAAPEASVDPGEGLWLGAAVVAMSESPGVNRMGSQLVYVCVSPNRAYGLINIWTPMQHWLICI